KNPKPDRMGPKVIAWFRADGRAVAWSDVSAVRVWDLMTGKETPELPGYRQGVQWAGFSPDGRSIYAAGTSGELGVWDAATGNPRDPLQMTSVRHSIHFVPTADRKRVVITGSVPNEANSDSWPSAVLLWDPAGRAAPVSLQQYPVSYYYAAQ